MKILSVYDNKAESYSPPMCFKTKGEAIRAFETTCKDPQSQFAMYSDDFTLIEIGEFNEQTGVLTPAGKLILLANASEFKKP